MQKSTDEIPNDEFQVHSAEETMAEYCDETQELGEGIQAYINYCKRCNMKLIAINQLPFMFMVNVCYPDGTIFGSIEVCSNCIFDILKPEKSMPGQ